MLLLPTKSEQIRTAVSLNHCILIHNFDSLPENDVFSATKKRRNSRRCHLYEQTTLAHMCSPKRSPHDIYIISTCHNADIVRCYRLLCPRYIRQEAAKERRKQTPADLYTFCANEHFSFDRLVGELQQLDDFLGSISLGSASEQPDNPPRLRFFANTTWQDAFLILEIFVTSLFLNSASSAQTSKRRAALVKIVDATGYHLAANKYNTFEINNLLNIYRLDILVAFLVWYLLNDKRNIALVTAWQPSLLNFTIFDLWAALAQQNCAVADTLSRLFYEVKSFGSLQIKCTTSFARQLRLGPYRRVVAKSPHKHKRLQHVFVNRLARRSLAHFSIERDQYVDQSAAAADTVRTFVYGSQPQRPPIFELEQQDFPMAPCPGDFESGPERQQDFEQPQHYDWPPDPSPDTFWPSEFATTWPHSLVSGPADVSYSNNNKTLNTPPHLL